MPENKNFPSIENSEGAGILLQHIAYWHNTIEEETKRLDDSSLEMTTFLTKIWDDEKSQYMNSEQKDLSVLHHQLHNKTQKPLHPIIYQYAPENQLDFEKNIKLMAKATSSIYPIIENLQKEIYSTLRPEPKQPNAEGSTNLTVTMPTPKKESFWQNTVFNRKKNVENPTDITSYTRSIDVIDETLQAPVFLRKFKDYHWKGYTRSQDIIYNKIRAQRFYLLNEIGFYHSTVEPRIQQIIDEARRLKIEKENKDIAPILADARERQQRKDMLPTLPP